MPVAAALASSLAWGIADFFGGLASRRQQLLWVLLLSQAVAGVIVTAAIAGARPAAPPAEDLYWAIGAGVLGLAGLACFYRALAIGTMSVVAPVSSTGTAIPVAFGVIGGDSLTALQAVAIPVAIVGVALAGRERNHDEGATANRQALVLSLFAAVGFGCFFTGMSEASEHSVIWAVWVQRLAGVTILAVLVASLRPRFEPMDRSGKGMLLAIGVSDLAAASLFAWASTGGSLSIVAVLGSLFPLFTVLFAHIFLHERLDAMQRTGVALTIVAVVTLASQGAG